MDIREFLKMPNCPVPAKIQQALKNGGSITPTCFENKNIILSDEALQKQAGFTLLSDGRYLVSMYCPMPGVTKEMVDWWFWWHPQNSDRYKAWYPGEHFSVGYAKKDKEYFSQKQMPSFKSNIQYPVEKIGKMALPLSIEFVSAEEFGFSEEIMQENRVATIVCGHVGALRGIVQHTEMAHIFFEREDGLFMVSRFWMGERLHSPVIRKAMINESTAKSMAEHCCVEYRNFAKRVPVLYKENRE